MTVEHEQLTTDELAYHKQVMRALNDAQAVVRSWGAFLGSKYQMGPTDNVTEDGHIVRGAKQVEPAPRTNPPLGQEALN